MKAILIILFLLSTIVSVGQDYMRDSAYSVIEGNTDTPTLSEPLLNDYSEPIKFQIFDNIGNIVVESDSLGNIIYHCITIQDFIKYKQECYNDSTRLYEWSCWEGMKFESYWYAWGDRPFNCECSLTSNYKYIHKQPSFEEFMDLMIKRNSK